MDSGAARRSVDRLMNRKYTIGTGELRAISGPRAFARRISMIVGNDVSASALP